MLHKKTDAKQSTKHQTSAAIINSHGYPLIGPTTTKQKGARHVARAARVQRAHTRHLANRNRATSIEWKWTVSRAARHAARAVLPMGDGCNNSLFLIPATDAHLASNPRSSTFASSNVSNAVNGHS